MDRSQNFLLHLYNYNFFSISTFLLIFGEIQYCDGVKPNFASCRKQFMKFIKTHLINMLIYFTWLQFREAFQRISSPSHFRTTLLLATLHLLIGFLYMGITTFATSKIREINDLDYFLLKRFVNNANYTELTFNSTIENVQYRDTIFRNVTFTHLDLNHVEFVDCLFDNVEFSNVKSSITYFENSTIKRSRYVGKKNLKIISRFNSCHF